MIISVINFSNGMLSDAEIQTVIRAVNRQLSEDFKPYWSIGATLRLEGRTTKKPDGENPIDMRGDAVIYIWDKSDIEEASGYHDTNHKGVPYGFVFLDVVKELQEEWSVTISHEAMELIGDPENNLLVAGPHPDPKKEYQVFFWYEMCDAVQNETYKIDGITVSNFVLPLYFTSEDEYTGRNDFLGTRHDNGTLLSFGVNPGGYAGFYDPKLQDHDTYIAEGDERAKTRNSIKSKLKMQTRRGLRYQKIGKKKNPKE